MIFNEGIRDKFINHVAAGYELKSNNYDIDEIIKDTIIYFKNNLTVMKELINLLKVPYIRKVDAYDPNLNTWDKATYICSINNDIKSKYKTKDIDFINIAHENIDRPELECLFDIYDKTKSLYIKSKSIVNRAIRINSKNSEAKAFTNECISNINTIMSEIEYVCGNNEINKYSLNESSIFDNIKFI